MEHSADTVTGDWVKTIDEGKGYGFIEPAFYRKMLSRMPRYSFYRSLRTYVRPGQRVLEAGSGWALSSFALAEEGVKMTVVDISASLIERLKQLNTELDKAEKRTMDFWAEDIFRLASKGQVFSAVCSDGTYQHFLEPQDRKEFLRTIAAILEPGGKFIVAVPNLHNPFFGTVVDEKMPAMQPFTVESLAGELQQAGFTVVEKGYSFVNPGFEQWVKSAWMKGAIHTVNTVFRFLPKALQRVLAAHLFCAASTAR